MHKGYQQKIKILLLDVVDNEYAIQKKYHPLGLSYLASYLPQPIREMVDIKIINKDYYNTIDFFNPQIIGISCVTQNYNQAIKISQYAKKEDRLVIVGKSHITALPESLGGNMDIGVLGEGEETFSELMGLALENRLNSEALRKVRGIVFRDGKNIFITDRRPLIGDLDSIPRPDRDYFDLTKGDQLYMFTSRGCPYNCRFCFSSRFWDRTRFHSADYVLSEMQEIYDKYHPLRITLCDDLFIADRKRLNEISNKIKQRNFYRKIKFTISVRSNLVDEKTAQMIREIGVDIVNMGLESGNARVLQYLKGENIRLQDHISAINIFKRHKMIVSASFIIGSPDETQDEILDTYNLIKKSKLDFFEINILTPLPGTPIWDHALSRGLVSNQMDWDRLNLDIYKHPDSFIFLSEKLNREQIFNMLQLFSKLKKRYHIKLMSKYIYKRPREIIRYIFKKKNSY